MNDEKKRKREACSSVSSTLDTSTGKRNWKWSLKTRG
jgi:hypothetical protein